MPTTSPPARELQGMAFDVVQQSVVLFGGYGAAGNLDDTWLWDGVDWTRPSLTTSPPARHQPAMASFQIGVLLFGGDRFNTDTWEWSLGQWAQRHPATTPPGRAWHAMAYDIVRQRVVMFGGGGSFGVLNDTWEWDGTDWIRRTPASSPSARVAHAMAYDSVRDRVVMFGGRDGTGTDLGDTWEWDGTNWIQRTPTTSPSARWVHGMTYDTLRARTVLFGGEANGVDQGDTWEWDGAEWVQRQPANRPVARRWHVVAYDEAREQVLLFGGFSTNGRQQDTWVYGTSAPARYTSFGRGCAGAAASPPALHTAPFSLPWAGDTFSLELRNIPASSQSAAFSFGFSRHVPPLSLTPIGFAGCDLLTTHVAIVTRPVQNGVATWSLPISTDPVWVGPSLFTQGILLDLFAGSLAVSNGGEFVVGSR